MQLPSSSSSGLEKDKNKLLSPNSDVVKFWEYFVMLTIFAQIFLDIFQAAFNTTETVTWVIVYACDLVYILDIVLQFFVGYFSGGRLISEPGPVRRFYLTRRFPVDIVTILPVEVLALVIPAASVEKLWAVLRLNRVIRIYRLIIFFSKKENELGTDTSLVRTIKYSSLSLLMIHAMTSCWYTLACTGQHAGLETHCYNNSWASLSESEINVDLSTTDTLHSYMTSFYWAAATATSTGYGDLHSMNKYEQWFSVAAMLTGIAVLFGLIMGRMTSMLTNFDGTRARYTHRLNTIKVQMKDDEIPESIQKKVVNFYEYLWHRTRGELDEGLYQTLPFTFQADVATSANKLLLKKALLLNDLDSSFIRMLSMVIKPVIYVPKQYITTRGEMGYQMLFVHRGEVELMGECGDVPTALIKHGKIFGEFCLVYNLQRPVSIRAATHCDLRVLDKEKMNKMLKFYPEVMADLQEFAEDAWDRLMSIVRNESRIRLSRHALSMSSISVNKSGHKERVRSHGRLLVHRTSSTEIFDDEPDKSYVEVKSGTIGNLRPRFSRLMERFGEMTINPDGRVCKMWEWVLLVVILITALMTSYLACFTSTHSIFGYGLSGLNLVFLLMCCFLDLFFIADVIIKLRTSVSTLDGMRTEFLFIVRHNCMDVNFLLDIMSILPIEAFCLHWSASPRVLWQMYGYLRVNRLLKCYRIGSYFKYLEESLSIDIGTIRCAKFFVYISLLTHWIACAWFLAACHTITSCASGSWVDDANITQLPITTTEYVSSLYWAAATMTSTGYGDIRAHTIIEICVATVAMLIGMLLYGFCVSSIAATLANLEYPRVKFQETIFAVKSFMDEHHLHHDLQARVVSYFSVTWRRLKGQAIPGGQRLMHDLPIELQMDIEYEKAQTTLSKVPFFIHTDVRFQRQLSLQTHTYVFAPGEVVIQKGDMGKEMYIIRRGFCELLSCDEHSSMCVLGPGQYFGELGFLFRERRGATIRASSYCEVLMLTRDSLDFVLKNFPALAEQFQHIEKNKIYLESLKKEMDHLTLIRDDDERHTKVVQLEESTSSTDHLAMWGPATTADFTKKRIGLEEQDEYHEPFQNLSLPARLFSFLLMRRTFIPESKMYKFWVVLVIIVSLIMTFTLTLQAAFLYDSFFLIGITYNFDLIIYIDIYIKFHTAFYSNRCVLVTHPLLTSKNYLKTTFVIDLIANIPFELLIFVLDTEGIEMLHTLAVLRLNRILNLYRVVLAFAYLESGIDKDTGTIKELKFVFYSLIFVHCWACFWYLIACPPNFITGHQAHTDSQLRAGHIGACMVDSWTSHEFLVSDPGVMSVYVTSLYWAAATSASVGYGDLHASNTVEMVVSLLAMIGGVLFFGYIIGSVAASLANADSQRANFQEKLTAVNQYLKSFDVDVSLRDRVESYYLYLWRRTKGVDPHTLFHGLTLSMESEVTLQLYEDLITTVPLFQNCERGFLKMLSMCIRPVYYLKGEYIVRKNDFGSEMFFINRGAVGVVSEDGEKVFVKLDAGKFFGEISLVFSCPRTASIRALTNCDLFVLTKSDLDQALTFYPTIKAQIYQTAEERRNAAMQQNKKPPPPKNDNMKTDDIKKDETPAAATPPTDKPENNVIPISCLCGDLFRRLLKFNEFTVDPNSRPVRIMTSLSCLLTVINSWVIAYQAAYQHHNIAFLVSVITVEFFYLFEVYIKFHYRFFNEYGVLVDDWKVCYKNYLYSKNGFWIDCVGLLPLSMFCFAANGDGRYMALSYLRLIHLLRLVRMAQFFSNWEKQLNINMLMVRLVKFLAVLLLMINFFACFWYNIACPLAKCHRSTWADYRGYIDSGIEPFHRYCDAVYWTVATMTSTGYGDIHATSNTEKVFAGLVMIVGKIIFGFILGNIASTLANAEATRVDYEERLQSVKDNMKDQELPPTLQHRVVEYFEYTWNRNKGVDGMDVLKDAPSCLQAEVALAVTGKMFEKVPLFAGAETYMLRSVSQVVRPIAFLPDEFIVKKGDLGDSMFFIHSGTVEVICNTDFDNPYVTGVLKAGDYFHQRHVIFKEQRNTSARARNHCVVFSLNKDDLQGVLEKHPDDQNKIMNVAYDLLGRK